MARGYYQCFRFVHHDNSSGYFYFNSMNASGQPSGFQPDGGSFKQFCGVHKDHAGDDDVNTIYRLKSTSTSAYCYRIVANGQKPKEDNYWKSDGIVCYLLKNPDKDEECTIPIQLQTGTWNGIYREIINTTNKEATGWKNSTVLGYACKFFE